MHAAPPLTWVDPGGQLGGVPHVVLGEGPLVERAAALEDGGVGQALGGRHQGHVVRQGGARAVPRHRHPGGVCAEQRGVAAHPAQRGEDVLEGRVARHARRVQAGEAERAQAVARRHHHHSVLEQQLGAEVHGPCRALHSTGVVRGHRGLSSPHFRFTVTVQRQLLHTPPKHLRVPCGTSRRRRVGRR